MPHLHQPHRFQYSGNPLHPLFHQNEMQPLAKVLNQDQPGQAFPLLPGLDQPLDPFAEVPCRAHHLLGCSTRFPCCFRF